MGFELNISSDLDIDTGSSFLDELDTSLPEVSDTSATDNAVNSTAVPQPAVGMPNNVNTNFSAQRHVPQGYAPLYAPPQGQARPYGGQPYQYGAQYPAQPDVEKLTTGQWVGTLFLSTCLGVISIVLLILWGFADGAKEPRKSFARAMLLVVPILYIVVFFGLGIIIKLADL